MLLAAIAADSLVPVAWQVRTGLHWLIEHFLAYFAVTLVFCLAWPRPFLVAACLMMVAGAMEALQGLTADRISRTSPPPSAELPACSSRRLWLVS
jgi:hypothetical protein